MERMASQYTAKYYWNLIINPSTNSMLIGISIEVIDESDDVVVCVDALMNADLFFRFPIQTAKTYMVEFAREYGDAVLFAADLEDATGLYGLMDVYEQPIVMKTYALRRFQRRWRVLYAEKMRKWRIRGSLMAQRHFEIHGNYRFSVIKYKN
jgi:hypothetical protein